MPVDFKFTKGIDLPSWHWLNFFAGVSYPGTANAYDGKRYIYFSVQYGTVFAASTTQLWRFDTWTNGWQYLSALTIGFTGIDVEYDVVRNVLWIAEGNNTTVWRFFNLNAVAVTLAGQTVQPFILSAAIGAVLPAAATTGASLVNPDDTTTTTPFPLNGSGDITGLADVTSTATSVVSLVGEFQAGMVGSYVRFTSGALSGAKRLITAVPNATTLTVAAFGLVPAAGDAFLVENPGGYVGAVAAALLAVTGGSTTTLVAAGAGWAVNQYRDADVVIVGGAGAGQRRRVASNDGTTLTLAGAVAGNARTGPFTTAPDATSTFRIVPSCDFVYLFVGSTSFYRCDVAATTVVWTTFANLPAANGAGANVIPTPGWAPFSVIVFQGGATSVVRRYDIGLQTWATLPSFWGAEALSTGGTVARVPDRPRVCVHIGGSSRIYYVNMVTGLLEPIPQLPYTPPVAYEGKRLRVIRVNGAEWIYFMRAGGQEMFRLAAEWMA